MHPFPKSYYTARTLAATMLMLCASHSYATESLTPKITTEGRGAQLAFYHSSCGEESAHECVAVDVGCTEPGQFKAAVFGMSAKEMGSLFAKEEGNAQLIVGAKRLKFLVRKVEYTDMDSNWTAELDDFPQAAALWKSISIDGINSISVGSHTRRLPTSKSAQKAFQKIALICSKSK